MAAETNRDTMSQNNNVPDTARNIISIKANGTRPISPDLHNIGGLAISVSAERPSTMWQSSITMAAVSPPQFQQAGDPLSRLQVTPSFCYCVISLRVHSGYLFMHK